MLHQLIHLILKVATQGVHSQFCRQRKEIEHAQRLILNRLLKQAEKTEFGQKHKLSSSMSYEEMIQSLPPTNWDDWKVLVEEQKVFRKNILAPDIKRFQPTSGSSAQCKWIPYSQSFLNEIDAASMAWLHDLYLGHPKISRGTHYWSLSWLPDELRSKTNNSDLEMFSGPKRLMLSSIMAVPEEVQWAKTSAASRYATMAWLASQKDLSLIFIWSPTFILALWEEMLFLKPSLISTLRSGKWDQFSVELSDVKCPQNIEQANVFKYITNLKDLVGKLWPSLALISCWDSAEASQWSQKLKIICPQVEIQGKGLFATEGVVTIPIENKNHLSYQSHFYEFELKDHTIIPAWKLEEKMIVSPMISTGSGLWRYRLGDWMEVEEIHRGCPILKFLGREASVDLVGEKLSFEVMQNTLKKFNHSHPKAQAHFFLATPTGIDGKPQYLLVCDGESDSNQESWVEGEFLMHHHYKLARELNQLSKCQILKVKNALSYFDRICEKYNWIKGNVKWEAIIRVPYLVE